MHVINRTIKSQHPHAVSGRHPVKPGIIKQDAIPYTKCILDALLFWFATSFLWQCFLHLLRHFQAQLVLALHLGTLWRLHHVLMVLLQALLVEYYLSLPSLTVPGMDLQ
jgi:hypothetical protein